MTHPDLPPGRTEQLRAFGETPDQIAVQLTLAFERFEAGVQARQGHWLRAPAQGRWSPAQVAEHVLIVNENIARVLRLLLSDKPLRALPREPGDYEGGRRKAPANLHPGEGSAWDELLPRWQANRAVWSELSGQLHTADPARKLYHPFFDEIDAHDWTRMVIAHLRQHRRQLEE